MRTLLVFAKEPVPGKVKTRLARATGPQRAVRLYRAFVEDVADVCRAVAADRVVWWVGGNPEGFGSTLTGFEVCRQPERGDLGVRLNVAFDEAFATAGTVVVVGTDCPILEVQDVDDLFAAAEGPGHAALLPAEDGGYAALALGRRCPEAFQGIPWSTPDVRDATCTALEGAGLQVTALPPVRDVDDIEDLEALARLLAETPGRAPHTARILLARPKPAVKPTP